MPKKKIVDIFFAHLKLNNNEFMFTVSNIKIKKYDYQINDLFILLSPSTYFDSKPEYIFIFEGWLYPDSGFSPNNICQYLHNNQLITADFKQFKGKFSGVFISLKTSKIFFFNDQLGLNNLFYFLSNNTFVASNYFSQIIKSINLSYKDLDADALNEFLFFEYPLADKTFFRNIKQLPLASVYTLNNNKLNKFNYWKYELIEDNVFKEKNAINHLEALLNQSINRIIQFFGKNKTYALGLSGGYDSMIVSYFSKINNVHLNTFTWGEPESEAYLVADNIAKAIGVNHTCLGRDKDLVTNMKKSIKHNPMLNILHAIYLNNNITKINYDVLFTGFNGDNQFGSHLTTNKNLPNSQISKLLMKRYGHGAVATKNDIKNQIINYLDQISGSTINKWDNFNYNLRQLKYIKDDLIFNYLQLKRGESIFEDIDLVEFALKIPYKWKRNRRFFKYFVKQKIPRLANIKAERELLFNNKIFSLMEKILRYIDNELLGKNYLFKKSHKDFKQWLKNDGQTYDFLKQIINQKNNYFDQNFSNFNITELANKLYQGKLTKNDIRLFFRLITIKLFLLYFIEKKDI